MGLSIGVSLAAFARGVGFCYLVGVLVILYVGDWFVFCFWYALYVRFLYRAVAPSPICLGEVLSVFRFFWEPWLLVLFVGHCPFGNKFLIIQKKKRERKFDLQGSGLAENGYVHCNLDFPATINLGMANDPTVKSLKSLVSMPVKTGGPLQFYMPHCADGKLVAKPPVEAVNEGIDMWKGCLVEQFLDKRLPFPVVRSLITGYGARGRCLIYLQLRMVYSSSDSGTRSLGTELWMLDHGT